MAAPLGSHLGRAVTVGVIGLGVVLVLSFSWRLAPAEAERQEGDPPGGQQSDASDDSSEVDPVWANAACYVCHMTFVREELSKVHLEEKVTCVECHGVSAGHANDEDIGATPPDVTFERSEIDASCAECHDEHDVPPRKIIARWLERARPNFSPVCTDCHGTHKIEKAEQAEEKEADASSGELVEPRDTGADQACLG